jgi:hypothetical protein
MINTICMDNGHFYYFNINHVITAIIKFDSVVEMKIHVSRKNPSFN